MPEPLKRSSELIAAEIRAELAKQEKTIPDLSEAIGIPVTTARRSAKGQRAMTIDEIADTASYLGIPVTELLRRAVAA